MLNGLKRMLLISHSLSMYMSVVIKVDLSIFVYLIILSKYASIEMEGGFLDVNASFEAFKLSISN